MESRISWEYQVFLCFFCLQNWLHFHPLLAEIGKSSVCYIERRATVLTDRGRGGGTNSSDSKTHKVFFSVLFSMRCNSPTYMSLSALSSLSQLFYEFILRKLYGRLFLSWCMEQNTWLVWIIEHATRSHALTESVLQMRGSLCIIVRNKK